MVSLRRFFSVAFLAIILSWVVRGGDIVQQVAAYSEPSPGESLRSPWSMLCEEKQVPGTQETYLWFNGDHQGKPWAGVLFRLPEDNPLTLTGEWLKKGFLRFLVDAGRDRYDNPGMLRFQVRPEDVKVRYQAVRPSFIDRGRGIDEDEGTWQEVLVPLSYWTDLKAGDSVTGIAIQCRHELILSFGLDEISLVRFDELPDWLVEREKATVCQPWVKWPPAEELPATLMSTPTVSPDGTFVGPDGKRIFVINPYCREDANLDMWGTLDESKKNNLPDHGLFDREKHGWIYQDLLTEPSLRRLGYNSYSATMPPEPFWQSVRYRSKRAREEIPSLTETAHRLGVPMYVDTVCWPWTLGAPGVSPDASDLLSTAITDGRNHWTPYRITDEGKAVWLGMWQVYAERYRDAGVPVFGFELLNEPAYEGVSDDHLDGFRDWLQTRYVRIDMLNETWQTTFRDWHDAVDFSGDEKGTAVPGRFFDYDEYLAGQFDVLVRDGVKLVTGILPKTLVGVQTMAGYAMSPHRAVWKYRFIPYETLVITPTGGGRWTPGSYNRTKPADLGKAVLAPAPLENDLLLAMAGSRMIYDNETYLSGQTAAETRNRLWKHVMVGIDGLSVFSWSKRGWVWWKSKAAVQTEAEKFPYCALNPIARRTEALRGIHDFSVEVQRLAPLILPKPWGPEPRVGILYSWSQARRRLLTPEMVDKTTNYYAALKYGHWNMRVVPSHFLCGGGLGDLDVLVVGGVRFLDSKEVNAIRNFVETGGTLIWGEETDLSDVYGRRHDIATLLKVNGKGRDARSASLFEDGIGLRNGITAVELLPGAEVLLRDSLKRPVVCRASYGKGRIYFQTADVTGFDLDRLLDWILKRAASDNEGLQGVPPQWRLADILEVPGNRRAVNVLCSRRSYDDHHAVLLMNQDDYERQISVSLPGLAGKWSAREALSGKSLSPAPDGRVVVDLAPGAPVVILLERDAH